MEDKIALLLAAIIVVAFFHLNRRFDKTMADLSKITAAVNASRNQTEALLASFGGIKDKLDAAIAALRAGDDGAALDTLANSLNEETAKAQDAVTSANLDPNVIGDGASGSAPAPGTGAAGPADAPQPSGSAPTPQADDSPAPTVQPTPAPDTPPAATPPDSTPPDSSAPAASTQAAPSEPPAA